MNTYVIDGYRRISKRDAFKRFCADQAFYACPRKLRPGFPWAPECLIDPAHIKEERAHLRTADMDDDAYNKDCFDFITREFEWYNCTWETGYYAAFYVK